jgi:hypothetical protein
MTSNKHNVDGSLLACKADVFSKAETNSKNGNRFQKAWQKGRSACVIVSAPMLR